MLTAASANMPLAAIAPLMQPATCAGMYAKASRQGRPPNAASTSETTGLKWPPLTGPNMRIVAYRPAAVAAAFSSSASPVSPPDSRCAAIPEPITIAARNAEPRYSARRRRASGAGRARSYRLTNITSIDTRISMAVDLQLTPKTKRPAGEPCCQPVVYPDVERGQAVRMAAVAKALGDPVRLQLVDVLRKHAGKVCVCELVPLFALSQPTVSHHLKVLREAGIVGSERQGLWAYYFVIPDGLEELSAWLS